MNDENAGIADEIRLVQRENMGDAVNLHGRRQARIMYLHAAHLMAHN